MKTTIKIGFSFGLLALLFNSWSWAASSNSFLTTISTQKDAVLQMYDSTYNRLYEQFQSSGAYLMQSLNYQSLVCLGVLSNGAFLQNLQSELKELKLNFLNQYNTIVASATNLEEKNRVYQDTKVSLFMSGSYEKDLAALTAQFNKLVDQQSDLALVYQKGYNKKLLAFVTEINGYTKKNKELLAQVSKKIGLLEIANLRFDAVSIFMDAYRLRMAGTGSALLSNIPMLKNTSISGLDLSLQTIANAEIKKYKILKTLPDALLTQKNTILSEFIQLFDTSYNKLISIWYNNNEYVTIQDQIFSARKKYLSGSMYKCSPILTNAKFETEMTKLIKDVADFSGSLASLPKSFDTGFQSKLIHMFDDLQNKQKSLVSAYKSYTQTMSQKMLADHKASSKPDVENVVSTGTAVTSGVVVPPIVLPPVVIPPVVQEQTGFKAPDGFKFTQGLKLNQVHKDVPILQQLLTSIGYYTGTIGTVYTNQTLSAVYHFQLDHGLLKGYEKKPQTRGWMGPATQAALNKLLLK